MYQAIRNILKNGDYSIVESFCIPLRQARYRQIPTYLLDSQLSTYLRKKTSSKDGLWNHQSLALEYLGEGNNVVVSTGTASGKSLIFRVYVFHRILLDSKVRVLVFYPLKALAADQLRGWQKMAEELGLKQDIIGCIDGSKRNLKEREEILERSRILIMTPDVCHAWMMSRLSNPGIKDFLRNVRMMVLDEAHTLEGILGSNFAFLLRRLLAAQKILLSDTNEMTNIQIVAASATIDKPQIHMKALTGQEFYLVTEKDDGSPQAERYCAHIASQEGDELSLVKSLHVQMLQHSQTGGFITFVDSRKGVESLARASRAKLKEFFSDDAVMPYRAGYDSKDREEIERRLQNGSLRGVVSTSALELGIDLPHLTVGLNVGVPAMRKSYRQRLGRIGRSGEGAFLIIAPSNAFTSYGTSFQQYHEMSVEPSYLYLDNRFMQFAHAKCLADELEALGGNAALPTHIDWPHGFKEVFNAAKTGGNIPPEFDAIAQLCGDSPHVSYPLRNVGEFNFNIVLSEKDPKDSSIGEINQSQALRECYPGGTYLHKGYAYEVVAWYTLTNAFNRQPLIRVRPLHGFRQTSPYIRTWINTGISREDIIDGNILKDSTGFLAECQMYITERVEGFKDVQTGEFRSYKELRQHNPNMRPRARNYRTSGVVLCINEEWFRKAETKQFVADRLLEIFCREYSVLRQDVGAAATNISVRSYDGQGPNGSCIVVFDQTYGSLRLTERLFLKFTDVLDRLTVAAQSEHGSAREQFMDIVNCLKKTYDILVKAEFNTLSETNSTEGIGYLSVFTPNSQVSLREKGMIVTDVTIIQPAMMDGKLMYKVECPPRHKAMAPVKRYVAAELIEASGGEWDYAWWNSETQEYEEPPEKTIVPN